MLLPNPASGHWMNTEKPGGRVYFVSGGTVAAKGKTGTGIGGSDSNDGLSPERPLLTVAQAHTLARAGAGDTIALLPGTVTLTGELTISNDDITIMGYNEGSAALPCSITSSLAASADTIDLTGDNITIQNVHFPAATAATTAIVNIAGAACTIRGCTFLCGANNVETITIPATGTYATIEDNFFHVTANGPDAAIEIEHASAAPLIIRRNIFDDGTDTNAWDVSAVNSDVNNLSLYLLDNICYEGVFSDLDGTATGVIARNLMAGGTLNAMLDPGSAFCFENYEADAIDESGALWPSSTAGV